MYACTTSRRENSEHRHLLPFLTHKLTFNIMRPPRNEMIYNLQPINPSQSAHPTITGKRHLRRRRFSNISRILYRLRPANIIIHPTRNLASLPNSAHGLLQIYMPISPAPTWMGTRNLLVGSVECNDQPEP